ncbi:hypothetical protein AGMMS50256_20380 [Betaproteobacteria bacterium]|nr:hypothetical protein AGMMS50256_20380 [Betaproteobacteria bacterium]
MNFRPERDISVRQGGGDSPKGSLLRCVMNALAWSRSMALDKAAAAAGVEAVGVDALFNRADVVSIYLVLSPQTRGTVGWAQLARLRKRVILINTSRAPLLNEDAA